MADADRLARGVFVNCPFDVEYKAKFDALIFTIYDCGFYPRCSKEFANSGKARFHAVWYKNFQNSAGICN